MTTLPSFRSLLTAARTKSYTSRAITLNTPTDKFSYTPGEDWNIQPDLVTNFNAGHDMVFI